MPRCRKEVLFHRSYVLRASGIIFSPSLPIESRWLQQKSSSLTKELARRERKVQVGPTRRGGISSGRCSRSGWQHDQARQQAGCHQVHQWARNENPMPHPPGIWWRDIFLQCFTEAGVWQITFGTGNLRVQTRAPHHNPQHQRQGPAHGLSHQWPSKDLLSHRNSWVPNGSHVLLCRGDAQWN